LADPTFAREAVASRAVFTLADATFTWSDVVAAARRYGLWAELEETSRRGVACAARLAAAAGRIDRADVLESAQSFRYARGLVAGEELKEWLAHWEVSEPEWLDHLRRGLLRERWVGELAETVLRFPVEDADVAAAVWPDAVCSGLLERVAQRLAGDGALAVEAGVAVEGNRDRALDVLLAAAVRAREQLVTPEAIEREVALHRLEWVRIEGDSLTVATADVAREAAFCVRSDGQSLADVARQCGLRTSPARTFVADAGETLGTLLLAAREGELIGPVPHSEGFVLLVVAAKTPPRTEDDEVRQRASTRIVERAEDRAVREHVGWHEHL